MKDSAKKGDLLVAAYTLVDPNFQGSVVLICDHDDASGSYGLMLNRPLHLPDDALEDYPFVKGNLYIGGPVQQNALQVLHPFGPRIPGAVRIVSGVWLGGDFEELQAGFSGGLLDQNACRFFLGYSGWGEHQLKGEFEQESWLAVPATAGLVLHTPSERLWLEAIRAGAELDPMFANFPEDPSMN
jgi:putative transcriptional regulator